MIFSRCEIMLMQKTRGGGIKKIDSIPEGRIRCRPAGVGGLFPSVGGSDGRRPNGRCVSRTGGGNLFDHSSEIAFH